MGKKRMPQSAAIRTLIDAALGYCEGAGVGLRHMPSDKEKEKIVLAVHRLWDKAYLFPLDNSVLSRYGLTRYLPTDDADPEVPR